MTQTLQATVVPKLNPTLTREPFNKRFNSLKAEGMKWYSTWQELSTWQNPTRGSFFTPTPNNGSKINHRTIIDSYARRCIRDFAAGMLSGLTSPSRPWFKLGLEDQDLQEYEPVKRYLDECTLRLHTIFGKSNIYDCLLIGYEEIATFGTSAMFIQEDYKDIIRGRSFTIGEYFIGTGPDCRVNAFARQFWMTTGQVVKEFGLESCSPNVQLNWRNNAVDEWVKVNLLIEENDTRLVQYLDWKNMEWRAVYFEEGAKDGEYLRMEGFEDFPVLAPRWATTTTADAYGKSPGWDALGDVKQLQKEQAEKLLGIAKKTNPPMQADATVQGAVNSLPGGLTRSSAMIPNVGVRPAYQIDLDLSAIREDIKEIKLALDDAYHRDLFRMMIEIQRTGVTATEIAEKQAERLNMSSPVVMKLTNELNNPLIANGYRIGNNMRMLPPPPKEIQGMDIKIQYVSILIQAQQMIGVSAIERNINFGINIAKQTGDMSILDNYNFDASAKEYARANSAPAKTMASPIEVVAKRKARAEAQAQAAKANQMAMAMEMAKSGAEAAKNASQAKLGEGSALDKIAGSGGMVPGNQ